MNFLGNMHVLFFAFFTFCVRCPIEVLDPETSPDFDPDSFIPDPDLEPWIQNLAKTGSTSLLSSHQHIFQIITLPYSITYVCIHSTNVC